MARITLEQITDNVHRLYEVARKVPDKRFMEAYRNQPDQRTLCGYTGAQMMKCFLSAGDIPDNIWFSEEWYKAIHNMLSCEGDSVWRSHVPLRAGGSARRCFVLLRAGGSA